MRARRETRRFRFWTREELVDAIRHLEEALATGARFVNYAGGGTVTYAARDEYESLLNALYNRVDEIDGVGRAPAIRHIRMIPGKGF